jgi:hypothetical protein
MKIQNALARLVIRLIVVSALLAAAVFVADRLPYPTDVEAPFYASGVVGQTVTTPTVALQVHGAKVADELALYTRKLQANGHWLVVEGTITARRGPGYGYAHLVIGGRTYTPDNRSPIGTFPVSMRPLAAGIPQRGVWVFEVPDDALKAPSAQFNAWVGDVGQLPRFFPRIPSITVALDEAHTPRVTTITPSTSVIVAS